jgi:hypothetical protein
MIYPQFFFKRMVVGTNLRKFPFNAVFGKYLGDDHVSRLAKRRVKEMS